MSKTTASPWRQNPQKEFKFIEDGAKKDGQKLKNRVLVLGVTFKENVRDVRNSRSIDLVRELESYECAVFVHDPMLGATTVEQLDLKQVDDPFTGNAVYDAIILAVPHEAFPKNGLEAYLGQFH